MNGKSTANRIVLTQLGATVLAALILYLAGGVDAATAAAAGGAIGVVTNFLFARQVFADGVLPARLVMRRFYVAEVVKLVSTIALFLGALMLLQLPFLPLLLGYGVTLAVYWAALLLPPAGGSLKTI